MAVLNLQETTQGYKSKFNFGACLYLIYETSKHW